ncbi:hypothetical protein OG216_00170 [Streptomycetaceae bacterium NBC_01309]
MVQTGTDLAGQRCQLPGGELAQATLRCLQATDAGGELVVDLAQRLLEILLVR